MDVSNVPLAESRAARPTVAAGSIGVSVHVNEEKSIRRSQRSLSALRWGWSDSPGSVECVCLFEQPHGLRGVVATLL